MTVNQLIEQLSKLPPEVRELQVWWEWADGPVEKVSSGYGKVWLEQYKMPFRFDPEFHNIVTRTHTLTPACPRCKEGVIRLNEDKTDAKCSECGWSTVMVPIETNQ